MDKEETEWLAVIRDFTINAMMQSIKANLTELGIQMDVFSSERKLVETAQVADAISALQMARYTGVLEPPKGQPDDWEPRTASFKATFWDDVDRPCRNQTKLDIFCVGRCHHADKVARTNGKLINIWGLTMGVCMDSSRPRDIMKTAFLM